MGEEGALEYNRNLKIMQKIIENRRTKMTFNQNQEDVHAVEVTEVHIFWEETGNKPYRIANPKIGNWEQNTTETPNRNKYKTQKTNLKYGQHHKTGNPNAPLCEVKPYTKIPLFWSQPTFTIDAPGVGPLTDDITTPAVKDLKRERKNTVYIKLAITCLLIISLRVCLRSIIMWSYPTIPSRAICPTYSLHKKNSQFDHSSLDFKSAVQFMKHFMYHFTKVMKSENYHSVRKPQLLYSLILSELLKQQ